MQAKIVSLREAGSSPPLYGIAHDNDVAPFDIIMCYRSVSSSNQTNRPDSAVFISARTYTGDRGQLRDGILMLDTGAVEVTFPFELIDSGRVTVEWLAGLSFARLITSNGLVFSKEIGLFGLAELALAKKVGLPIFDDPNMIDTSGLAGSISLVDSIIKLLTSDVDISVLDEVSANADWFKRTLGLDVGVIINSVGSEMCDIVRNNSFKQLILLYLNNPDCQLDNAQSWVVSRLEGILRKVPNKLIERFLPRPGHGEIIGCWLDESLFFGEAWRCSEYLYYFGEDGRIREATKAGDFQFKNTRTLDELPLIIN